MSIKDQVQSQAQLEKDIEDKLNALYTRLNMMEDELNHIKEVFKSELDTSDANEHWEADVEYAYQDDE